MTTFLGYLPRCTLLILIICFGASALSGATISPFGYAVEAMIASETDEVLFLPTLGGVALASIAFQSSIDPAGQSFSYSTAPGQVYNGHSLVLSVSASLIAATGEWDWTTSGELGDPQPLTGFGKWMCGQFSNGSAACTDDAQKTGVINTHQMSSVETISVSSDGNTILSLQTYLELVNNLPVRTEDDTDRTTLGALIESFQNGPTPGTSASSFRVDSSGSNDVISGIGTFVVNVTPVPEPGGRLWCLVVIAILRVGFAVRDRRRLRITAVAGSSRGIGAIAI